MTVDWDGLKALEAKATKSPWHAPGLGEVHNKEHDELLVANYRNEEQESSLGDDDASFVAAVRNAFPAICAAHERDQREIEAAEKMGKLVDELCTAVDAEGQDVGGCRGSLIILGELGPAWDEFDKAKQL